MRAITAGLLALAALGGSACKNYSATGPSYPSSNATEPAAVRGGRTGFGFNGSASGAPTGEVLLTGGGSFDAQTASDVLPSETDISSGGGFRCVAAVAQGPLAGCAAGEGVRWSATQLLASAPFKCTGADAAKTAVTGPGTVALVADFFRAGDGTTRSFSARIVVSDRDIAPDIPGRQTLWIQGAGCGDAVANFSN